MQPVYRTSTTAKLIVTAVLSVATASVEARESRVGVEFLVNTYTDFNQVGPAPAAHGNGGFVVVWSSANQDAPGSYAVVGRRFDSAGAALAAEFVVNSYTSGSQTSASVAADSTGGFMVVWQTPMFAGGFEEIAAQRFASNGEPAGTELVVNAYTTGAQVRPAVAALTTGFVVVWDSTAFSETQDGDGAGVFGQLLAADGSRLGSEFSVNTYTTSNQYGPRISTASDGRFVVVWQSTAGLDGDGHGVFAQRFDADAARFGTEFQINSYTTSSQYSPAVAHLASNDFVVVWTSAGADGQSTGVAARRFAADGLTQGDEFVVNTSVAGAQYDADVVAAAAGFVVMWTSAGSSGTEVNARLFDSLAVPIGSEFQVNTHTNDDQKEPRASFIGPRGLVATWRGDAQDGSGSGIFAQLFEIDFTAPTTTTTTTTLPSVVCGNPLALALDNANDTPSLITASDALFILRAVVGLVSCEPCVCDVDGSGSVAATDALAILRLAVGQPFELACPPCTS